MVLVRVGQDHGVDPPVPRRDPLVEHDEQPVRVGSAVDEQPTAAGALDEDRVALADVEDRDPGDPGRSRGQDAAGRPRPRRRGRPPRLAPSRGRARGWAPGSARRRSPRRAASMLRRRPVPEPADRRSTGRSTDPPPPRQRRRAPRAATAAATRSNGGKRHAGERQPGGRHRRSRRGRAGRPSRARRGRPRRPAARRPSTSAPPTSATTPAAIAGATSGTTARLTTGDRTASRPNETRTIGSVAAWAASDTPRLSASQPGTRPRPSRSIQAVEGRRPGDQPGGRQRRQLEPGVADERRVRDEQERRRPAERRRGPCPPGRSPARAGRRPAISAGPDDRRRGAREGDVGDDREHRHDRPPPPPEPAGHRRDRGRDDRDVPAGDRDDVADAGRREGGREVPIDPVAQPDRGCPPRAPPRAPAGPGRARRPRRGAAPRGAAPDRRARVGRRGSATSASRPPRSGARYSP